MQCRACTISSCYGSRLWLSVLRNSKQFPKTPPKHENTFIYSSVNRKAPECDVKPRTMLAVLQKCTSQRQVALKGSFTALPATEWRYKICDYLFCFIKVHSYIALKTVTS
jgi:hypothetical protein